MHYAQQARSFIGRRLAEGVKDASTGEVIFEDGTYVTSEVADRLRELPQTRVHIRTPLQSLSERLVGRISLETVKNADGEILVREGEEIDRYMADAIEQDLGAMEAFRRMAGRPCGPARRGRSNNRRWWRRHRSDRQSRRFAAADR